MAKSILDIKEEMIISLNCVKVKNLNANLKQFIEYIFPNIKENDFVKCENYNGNKIDLIIIFKNERKYISLLKEGLCCVYKDRVKKLVSFLWSIGVSTNAILAILAYHYADGTYDGSGENIAFGELLSFIYKKEIEVVNNEFKNIEILLKLINHLLFLEKSGKSVDYFYVGDVRKGVFISQEELKFQILNHKDNYKHKFMRIGIFNFMPLKREVCNYNDSYDSKHQCILRINLMKYIKKTRETPC